MGGLYESSLTVHSASDDEIRTAVANKWMARFMIFEDEHAGVDLIALLKHLRQNENLKYLVRKCFFFFLV